MLAMELEDIERERFDELLAKRQIGQYFLPSIHCTICYLSEACRFMYFHLFLLLNEARAWFLIITFTPPKYVCVYAPEAINN